MNEKDEQFLSTLHECYPLERYIFKNPYPINEPFKDVFLTEIFIPTCETGWLELKTVYGERTGKYDKVSILEYADEFFLKLETSKDTLRLPYNAFENWIREDIRIAFFEDFGRYEWECLFVDYEKAEETLTELFSEQKKLILNKYGECNIKKLKFSKNDEFVK